MSDPIPHSNNEIRYHIEHHTSTSHSITEVYWDGTAIVNYYENDVEIYRLLSDSDDPEIALWLDGEEFEPDPDGGFYDWTRKKLNFDPVTGDYISTDIFYDDGTTANVTDDWVVTEETFRPDGTLASRVQFDEADVYNWDTITTTFWPDGVTPQEVVTIFDNGSQTFSSYYENGNLKSGVEIDGEYGTAGEFDWAVRIFDASEDGVETTDTTVYDDGTSDASRYENGIRVLRVVSDSDDPGVGYLPPDPDGGFQEWIRQTYFYNGDGSLASIHVLFDNGLEETTTADGVVTYESFYPDGTLASTTLVDENDAYDWTDEAWIYGEDGVITGYSLNYDNGYSIAENYEDGLLSTRIEEDGPEGTDGQFDWRYISSFYNDAGDLTAKNTTFDDGVVETVSYNTNGTLNSVHLEDADDAHDWALEVSSYDDNGVLELHLIEYDDGYSVGETYVDGVLSWEAEIDGPDADNSDGQFNWRYKNKYYDAEGDLIRTSIEYDNGTGESDVYQGGVVITHVEHDADYTGLGFPEPSPSKHKWQVQFWNYDLEGNLTSYEIQYDNGRVDVTTYGEDGTSIILEDLDDHYGWQQITKNFDENGLLEFRETIYDDGRIKTENWLDGVRTDILQEDPDDAKSWDRIEYQYDENGLLAVKSTANDDGTTKEEYWEDGVRTETLQQDPDDAKTWHRIEYQYDENGLLAYKRSEYDDGRIKTENWQDGVRTDTLFVDPIDAVSWGQIEYRYDANGVLEYKSALYDDGTTKEEFWLDGVRTEILQEDPDNAKSWSDITSLYDEEGNFLSKTINYDNGDTYEKTVALDIFDIEEMGLVAEYTTLRTNYGPESSWAEHFTIEFNGPYYLKYIDLDNGNEKAEAFLPDLDLWGEVKLVGELDDADLYSWEEKSIVNSLTLDRKDIYYRFDNADEELTYIDTETDQLEFYAQRDTSDQEDWQGQQSFYEDGELLRIATQSDAGDFEIEYFSGGISTGTETLSSTEYEDLYGDFNAVWDPYFSAISVGPV